MSSSKNFILDNSNFSFNAHPDASFIRQTFVYTEKGLAALKEAKSEPMTDIDPTETPCAKVEAQKTATPKYSNWPLPGIMTGNDALPFSSPRDAYTKRSLFIPD